MRIYDHFAYTGRIQRWVAPDGVTSARFECWGAAGGMPSALWHEGSVGEVVGGGGPRNDDFTNSPSTETSLGVSFANNAGYAAGTKAVTPGDSFDIYVGGNGAAGYSTIRRNSNGAITYSVRGGDGGWNGGGNGGSGALTFQNLYNATSPTVNWSSSTMPKAAKVGQLWHDTSANLVKRCNTTYTSGNGTSGKWDVVTSSHPRLVGPSGGGGGGATDVRPTGGGLSNRLLVAGGGGGAGGHFNTSGTGSWALQTVPATPSPPFGTDFTGTATGEDYTWNTTINYLTGGWGGGGMGGAVGPSPTTVPATNGGKATPGGAGGPATGRHVDGSAPPSIPVGGGGGTGVAGGAHGPGNAVDGAWGQGGQGGNASGAYDDWCAGGGGGGGGYYGGGGGGQGFKVIDSQDNTTTGTRGGGGGGGSNFADAQLSNVVLVGGARPVKAQSTHPTGANGLGGFCRVSYNRPPSVKFNGAPNSVLAASPFNVDFTYLPAQSGGAAIAYYQIGTATSPTADAPTSQTTVQVTDPSQTQFTWQFTAPAAGVTNAYFVRAVDTDGDTSPWLRQAVTGLAQTATTGATITAPAANSNVFTSAAMTWTLGTQSPLVAYRLGYSGYDPITRQAVTSKTGWARGGSRVNLALDPGFVTNAVWSSVNNMAPVTTTSLPGVSGSSGVVVWNTEADRQAEIHTTPLNNLRPGMTYRLHLEVASGIPLDNRPVAVQVWDQSGLLTSKPVSWAGLAAGTYVTVDVEFTPHTQGVYFQIVPSAVHNATDTPLGTLDFEDGTVGAVYPVAPSTVAVDTTYASSGTYSLKVTTSGTAYAVGGGLDLTPWLTNGAGDYVFETWAYAPGGSTFYPVILLSGAGLTGVATYNGDSRLNTWVRIRAPFHWDGSGAASVYFYGSATTASSSIWYDDVAVYPADLTSPEFGNVDGGQGFAPGTYHYLRNMLVEPVYTDDSAGYPAYFDGTNLNGLTGAVSWSGAVNASPSYLTGTDVTSGTLVLPADPLNNALLLLDTLSEPAMVAGYDAAEATLSVVKGSLAQLPTVVLNANSQTAMMELTINAADAAAQNKITSFDILRSVNGATPIRIAKGLTPDNSTRIARYSDPAPLNVPITYTVRAYDAAGGASEQTTGTVTSQ